MPNGDVFNEILLPFGVWTRVDEGGRQKGLNVRRMAAGKMDDFVRITGDERSRSWTDKLHICENVWKNVPQKTP